MEIGIDCLDSTGTLSLVLNADGNLRAMEELLKCIGLAHEAGLNFFGVRE